MAGRYGADHLSIALMLLSLLFMIAASLSGWVVFSILSLVPMAWCFPAAVARIARRRAENEGFLRRVRGLTPAAPHSKADRGHPNPSLFPVSAAGIALRAPRERKIRVSCSKCGNRFETRT